MQHGTVQGLDKPVARLVQGTAMFSGDDPEGGLALLDAVFAAGARTFDTAHNYGRGAAERVLGRWLRERGVRDRIVIVGKGAHPYDGRVRVTPEDITADLLESLDRLGVERIDLYLLHRDNPDVPVGPLVEILNEHQRAGRIGACGGSNWTHERIAEANTYAAAHGLTPFVASSPNFSLAEQFEEPWAGCLSIGGARGEAVRAWYARTELPLFTWSSLAGGFFTGRYTRDNLDAFAESPNDRPTVRAYCYEENFRRLDRARELAAERRLSVPQLALAYVMSQPLNIFPLVGCRSGDEFRENVAASEVRLSPEEIAWLELRSDSQ